MSPKSSPAATGATAAVVAITVLTLSLPNASAETRPRSNSRSAAAATAPQADTSLWHQVLALFGLDGTSTAPQPPVHGNAGCEMDPDGVVHVPPPPKTCT
jgi:hypothetical protein